LTVLYKMERRKFKRYIPFRKLLNRTISMGTGEYNRQTRTAH